MKIQPKATAATLAAFLAAAMLILAAGCGSSGNGAPTVTLTPATSAAGSATSSPTATPPTGTPAGGGGQAQGPGRCHTSMLTAVVAMGSPGAGQRYAFLVLTNVSGVPCLVYGFPGMLLQTSSLAPIVTHVIRGPTKPQLVTVPPGQHVFSLLHWTVVPAADETTSPCEPNPAVLEVTPPDEVATLSTPWPGGSVCQHGQIDVSPFKLGTGT